jgi:hypothetical protein
MLGLVVVDMARSFVVCGGKRAELSSARYTHANNGPWHSHPSLGQSLAPPPQKEKA